MKGIFDRVRELEHCLAQQMEINEEMVKHLKETRARVEMLEAKTQQSTVTKLADWRRT